MMNALTPKSISPKVWFTAKEQSSIWLVCVTITFACLLLSSPSVPAQEDTSVTKNLPIYGSAAPFVAKYEATTRFGSSSVTIDVDKTLAALPETLRPWKPEELEGVNLFLPLGEGESIDDKVYHFSAAWNDDANKPCRIGDLFFTDPEEIRERVPDHRSVWKQIPTIRYRPITLVNNDVIRCQFEFQPIQFSKIDFQLVPGQPRPQTEAAKPELLAPLRIDMLRMKLLINGKNDGFIVHFSRDGKNWFPIWNDKHIPYMMLPFKTLHVRIATRDGRPITAASIEVDAILETHGFRGQGATCSGRIVKQIGKNKREIDLVSACLDPNGDLNLLIDNREEKPLEIGGLLAHNYCSQEPLHMFGGAYFADGFFSGPTIPPKSLGVFTFPITKEEPGEHTYHFHAPYFSFQGTFLVPPTAIDRIGPNPPPGGMPLRPRVVDENGNDIPDPNSGREEYIPEDKSPSIRFDTDLIEPKQTEVP